MKLIFIGTGSAFTVGENYQSNMLLESDTNQKLLIDCGTDARRALHELGLNHRDIQAVYISHLHADHIGGLEWLAFSTKFDSPQRKISLYASHALIDDLWNSALKAGLSSLQGLKAELSTYFKVNAISDSNHFEWDGNEFRLVKTTHIICDDTIMPSYGLLFHANGCCVFITTDAQIVPDMIDFYEEADIIFHDCETAPYPSGVHAHYKQLVALDPKIKAKIWLYHYQLGPLPDARKDGFRGFIQKGQCFDFQKAETLFSK